MIIESLTAEQFCMGALFHNTASVEDENPISLLNGAEPVRNDKRGPTFHESVKRVLNE